MRRIDENLPLQQKKLLQIIEKEFNGNVSDFSRCIGKSQQVVNRLFNIDKRSGKYPTMSLGIIQSVCDAFGLKRKYFYEEEDSMDIRIQQVIKETGLDDNEFAHTVDIEPIIFDKKIKGILPWTLKDAEKISEALNVRKGWLLDGEGEMFLAPAEMKETETPQSGKPEDVLLEVHASCIRRLEDERTRVIEELKEIRELKEALRQNLKEIKSLKDVLVEAARALNHEDHTHVASGPR